MSEQEGKIGAHIVLCVEVTESPISTYGLKGIYARLPRFYRNCKKVKYGPVLGHY